jgi:phosphoglycolate phosphatase
MADGKTKDALTLVFDLDGTLVDTAADLMGTLNMILAREGAQPLPVEKAHSLLGAGARALIERGFALDGRVVDEPRMDVLYRDSLDHYAERIAEESRPFDGVEPQLTRLSKQGHRLAVCTNKVTWHSRKLLEALGLSKYFASICGRDAFAYFKPDPRHLTLTVAEAGGDVARTIMVGDSKTDIETARSAGLPSICVDFGYTDIPAVDLGATRVISHFDELGEAIDAIAASFDRARA